MGGLLRRRPPVELKAKGKKENLWFRHSPCSHRGTSLDGATYLHSANLIRQKPLCHRLRQSPSWCYVCRIQRDVQIAQSGDVEGIWLHILTCKHDISDVKCLINPEIRGHEQRMQGGCKSGLMDTKNGHKMYVGCSYTRPYVKFLC